MTREFTMPKLGHLMEEGTIVRWHKAEGDFVNKDEVLLEIETDKATLEVESPFTGTLLEILIEEQDDVPVGTPIARYAEAGED